MCCDIPPSHTPAAILDCHRIVIATASVQLVSSLLRPFILTPHRTPRPQRDRLAGLRVFCTVVFNASFWRLVPLSLPHIKRHPKQADSENTPPPTDNKKKRVSNYINIQCFYWFLSLPDLSRTSQDNYGTIDFSAGFYTYPSFHSFQTVFQPFGTIDLSVAIYGQVAFSVFACLYTTRFLPRICSSII